MKSWTKESVKRIPGAVTLYLYEGLARFWFQIQVCKGVPWQWMRHLVKPIFRLGKKQPNNFIVAVTVSTNYSDLLRICLDSNKGWFGKWIVVTDASDKKTRETLAAYPEIVVLFWNPRKNGAIFDKGSAVRLGQEYAYLNYPNSWYLIIDSDIVLEGEPAALLSLMPKLKPTTLYGAERWDFASLHELRQKTRSVRYGAPIPLHGYFQLYAIPYFYARSKDASLCDIRFSALFQKTVILDTIFCFHLGNESHWRGREENSQDFIQ